MQIILKTGHIHIELSLKTRNQFFTINAIDTQIMIKASSGLQFIGIAIDLIANELNNSLVEF